MSEKKLVKCQYCLAEIEQDAYVCPHCNETVRVSLEEAMTLTVASALGYELPVKSIPSACKVYCHWSYSRHRNKGLLQDCLNTCEVNSAIKIIAEKLRGELFDSFTDVIWGGGDIDPLDPLIFERAVRENFAKRGKPD